MKMPNSSHRHLSLDKNLKKSWLNWPIQLILPRIQQAIWISISLTTLSRFKQREQKGRLNWNMDRMQLDSNWNRLKNRWSNKTTFCHRRTHFYKSRIRFLIDFLRTKVHLKWWKSYKFNRTTNKLGHRLLKVIDARMMTQFTIRSILLSRLS